MSRAYVVETLGRLGCSCGGACRACSSERLGDFINPWTPWDNPLVQKLADALRERIDEAKKSGVPWINPWTPWNNPIVPDLPKPPDPVPPALELAGPSGWGPYVGPGLLVAAAVGAALFIHRRRKAKQP